MKSYLFTERRARRFSSIVLTLALLVAAAGFGMNANAQETMRGGNRVVVMKASAADDAKDVQMPEGSLKLGRSIPLDAPDRFSVLAPTVVSPAAVYSNVTNFLGQAFSNGGAAADPAAAANTITTLVADDLTLSRSATLVGFTFSVANLNTVAVSARPRVRFYRADGANGGPGTVITGFSFAAISFPAGNVSLFNANFTAPGVVGFGTIWAGITFDNNSGATGATAAQLNNLGQGLYNPPDVGTSADLFFRTTTNGSFFVSNPAGMLLSFNNPAAPANFGWELRTNAPTAGSVSVGGRVSDASGEGIALATVKLTDSTGATRTARTDRNGVYRFDGVTVGETYVFGVRAKRLEFAAQVVNISEGTNELNFSAIQ